MMPSVTVGVSSCTDIYISPGLYGDCLPTIATAWPRIHSGPSAFLFATPIHARTRAGTRTPARGRRGDTAVSPAVFLLDHRTTPSAGRPGGPGFTSHGRNAHRQTDVKRL
ncbi:hypothetical protein E4K10_11795 [Streptomyces sp. T1317-0309]|nr:hypothetical protein E4K10_11795 [Streptomyces sp. T1317-0309]